jgi:hypothetical protein
MSKQNFAATAKYFEQRAHKAPAGARRDELQRVARHYAAKAAECGHRPCVEPQGVEMASSPDAVPTRRQRLAELFRSYGNPESS